MTKFWRGEQASFVGTIRNVTVEPGERTIAVEYAGGELVEHKEDDDSHNWMTGVDLISALPSVAHQPVHFLKPHHLVSCLHRHKVPQRDKCVGRDIRARPVSVLAAGDAVLP